LATTTAAQKIQGPRGDFTCKQQPLRSCLLSAKRIHQHKRAMAWSYNNEAIINETNEEVNNN
jgi:hypothetical protein